MPSIRFVVLCVFRDKGRILVGKGYDGVKDEEFLRPLGGSVEFGESAVEAVRREIREELRAEVTELVQLGFVENIFTCDGQPGHEIVAVFDAKFADSTLYAMDRIPLFEEWWGTEALWISLADLPAMPLYPDGLVELVAVNSAPDG